MAALIAYYVAHKDLLSSLIPLLIAVLDYIIGKNPNSPASNILHWVELQLRGLKGDEPQPPVK